MCRPETIEEAMADIDVALGDQDREIFLKEDPQGIEEIWVQMEIGRFFRNRWGLWHNSKLSQSIRDFTGIDHPDDLSAVVFARYRATTNNPTVWEHLEED